MAEPLICNQQTRVRFSPGAPLVVDHIDGDSTNHSVSNFRLVCGNCDTQLPTYKSKNKSKRSWRKKYYSPI